jgi:hypothetical protein
MNHSIYRATFRCLLGALPCLPLCVSNNSNAQVQVTSGQGDCSQGNMPCTTIASQQGTNNPQLSTAAIAPFGPGQVAIIASGSEGFGLQDQAAAVKDEPYQAQAVTEMKQTLADGSHIVQKTTATVARDNDGRTVRIQKLRTMGPWRSADSSPGNSPTLTSIFDPVAKEHIDYTSDNKVAHVSTMAPLPPGAVAAEGAGVAMSVSVADFGPAPAGAVVQRFGVQARMVSPEANEGLEPKTESLGAKTVEGVQVTGTRSTTTIPAGTIGNDKDLIITRETWYSPELKLVIQSTQNDPRFGQTTYSLTDIQQGPPDEALFQVPADYKIDKIVPRILKAPSR